MNIKLRSAIIFAAILATAAISCTRGKSYRTADGSVWRTTYHMVYCSEANLDDSVIDIINTIDRSLSPFNRSSIISAVNRGDTSALADRHLCTLMNEAMRVWKASDGRFDPTLGPAIKLWGFGPMHGNAPAEVTQQAIDSVRQYVGFGECHVSSDGHIAKKHPATEFNFSAIAKGYACDEIAAMLRRNGVTDYLVEIGGEIALAGLNSHGKPWRVMIDAPTRSDTSPHNPLTFIEPREGGVATSGNYRNYRDIGGSNRIGHTILPSTCRPAPGKLLSVTVTASTCMLADALATACMTGDTTDARHLISRFPATGCLIVCDDSTIVTYGEFPATFVNNR